MALIVSMWNRLTGRAALLKRIEALEAENYAMEDQITGLQELMEQP